MSISFSGGGQNNGPGPRFPGGLVRVSQVHHHAKLPRQKKDPLSLEEIMSAMLLSCNCVEPCMESFTLKNIKYAISCD